MFKIIKKTDFRNKYIPQEKKYNVKILQRYIELLKKEFYTFYVCNFISLNQIIKLRRLINYVILYLLFIFFSNINTVYSVSVEILLIN